MANLSFHHMANANSLKGHKWLDMYVAISVCEKKKNQVSGSHFSKNSSSDFPFQSAFATRLDSHQLSLLSCKQWKTTSSEVDQERKENGKSPLKAMKPNHQPSLLGNK